FCNRQRDKLKILHWSHNGFWLYYRRLERSTPAPSGASHSKPRDLEGEFREAGVRPPFPELTPFVETDRMGA
ncbi:IS66 family insertion sequence element accessory protein TnpB, partial [Alicyclobacillus sendaiensis]